MEINIKWYNDCYTLQRKIIYKMQGTNWQVAGTCLWIQILAFTAQNEPYHTTLHPWFTTLHNTEKQSVCESVYSKGNYVDITL